MDCRRTYAEVAWQPAHMPNPRQLLPMFAADVVTGKRQKLLAPPPSHIRGIRS